MTLPRGVLNNNPLNIRRGVPWNGLADDQPDTAFDKFKDATWGFRAGFVNLFTYQDKYGINTVRKVINKWAPPEDNNPTLAYIQNVCKHMGVMPDEPLDLRSWNDASRLVYAMTIQEQGSFAPYFQHWQLEEGARKAGVVGVPARLLVKTMSGVGTAITTLAGSAIVAGPEIVSTAQQYMPVASSSPALSSVLKLVLVLGIGLTIIGLIRKNKRHGV